MKLDKQYEINQLNKEAKKIKPLLSSSLKMFCSVELITTTLLVNFMMYNIIKASDNVNESYSASREYNQNIITNWKQNIENSTAKIYYPWKENEGKYYRCVVEVNFNEEELIEILYLENAYDFLKFFQDKEYYIEEISYKPVDEEGEIIFSYNAENFTLMREEYAEGQYLSSGFINESMTSINTIIENMLMLQLLIGSINLVDNSIKKKLKSKFINKIVYFQIYISKILRSNEISKEGKIEELKKLGIDATTENVDEIIYELDYCLIKYNYNAIIEIDNEKTEVKDKIKTLKK